MLFISDGAIYVTNEQDDDEDFIDDMIHEIAHLVENTYGAKSMKIKKGQ